MSKEQHTAGTHEKPPHVPTKPGWYRTLDEAIHAWAVDNDLHGEQAVPKIRVMLGPHVQGWNVQ